MRLRLPLGWSTAAGLVGLDGFGQVGAPGEAHRDERRSAPTVNVTVNATG